MPWFCHSAPKRKRSSKARVGGVGKVARQHADNSLTDNQPAFAVVLQSFSSSIGDELTVQRGQVVEVMYHDGDWTFVRNLDAGSGYIPKVYCLSLDQVKGDFNNTMLNHVQGPLPRPRVINVDTLQRSGSSVNSVEVHQVTSTSGNGMPVSETSEPTDTNSASRTSSSSQAIYEVPRSPAQRYSFSHSQPTPEVSSEATPLARAPSLPPRSVCLPSSADMQRQSVYAHRPGFLPGCRQGNPFTVAAQAGTPGTPSTRISPVLRRSASHRSAAGRQVGNRSPPSSAPFQSGGESASLQATPTPGSAHPIVIPLRPHPLNMGRNSSGHSGESSPSSVPTSAKHSPAGRADRNPSASPSISRQGGVVGGRGHMRMRGGTHRKTEQVASTPGAARVPAVAPSPISARVAMTPGTPPTTTVTTPGGGSTPKTRLAATPSSAAGVETNSQWPIHGADSTPPSHKQRGYFRRYRQNSSEIQESCISEDSNVVTYHSPPQTATRNHPRRQSQPCVTHLGLHSPQQRRPSRLQVRRSLSMQDTTDSVPIHRARSYQEAVLGEDERRFGATASLKPSEIIRNDHNGPSRDHKRPARDHGHRVVGKLEAAEPDDVFLPDTKKPYGIFRCTKDYQQTFKGEISLKKNELVIVLDHGRGEWAWAVTSNSEEGLIPKCVLSRYQSGLGAGGTVIGSGSLGRNRNREKSDAGTQTDQDTHAACPDQDTPACPDSSGTFCRSGSAAVTSAAAIPSSRNRHTIRSSSSEEIDSGHVRSYPKEWFDTMDSVDAARVVSQIDSEPCNTTRPSPEQPTPHTARVESQIDSEPCNTTRPSPEQLTPHTARVESQIDSEPCNTTRPSPEQPTPHTAKPAASKVASGTTGSKIPVRHQLRKTVSVPHDSRSRRVANSSSRPTQLVKSGTVHYHDRISGTGSVSFDGESNTAATGASTSTTPSTPLTPQAPQQSSTILTAIKDYTPKASSSNCLPLKRGDLLHLQPHMHYPKGWMWVWHTKRRSFGFVPKSAVAYTYNTPPRERRNTVEDAV